MMVTGICSAEERGGAGGAGGVSMGTKSGQSSSSSISTPSPSMPGLTVVKIGTQDGSDLINWDGIVIHGRKAGKMGLDDLYQL